MGRIYIREDTHKKSVFLVVEPRRPPFYLVQGVKPPPPLSGLTTKKHLFYCMSSLTKKSKCLGSKHSTTL